MNNYDNIIIYIFFSILNKKSSAKFKYPFSGNISLAATNELIHKQFRSNWVLSSKKGLFFLTLLKKFFYYYCTRFPFSINIIFFQFPSGLISKYFSYFLNLLFHHNYKHNTFLLLRHYQHHMQIQKALCLRNLFKNSIV